MEDRTDSNETQTTPSWVVTDDDLSKFIIDNLINRPETYATYLQATDISKQTPRIINKRLTEQRIKDHLHADHQKKLIAVPTRSEDDTGRFVMIDIRLIENDSEEYIESDSEEYIDAHEQAQEIYHFLLGNGIKPIFCESPAMDRYNIWIVFSRPIPAGQLIRFGDAVLDCCRHRMPTSAFNLHLAGDGAVDGVPILTKNNRIAVYPRNQDQRGHAEDDFVPLPCLLENSFDYSYDGYSDLHGRGQRMFMGGLSLTDNSFALHLNDPSLIDPENFVYDPIMTVLEFARLRFTGSEKPIDKVLARLKGVQRCGVGWKGCCTSHVDFTRSLLISENEKGNVLLHCCKRCPLEKILKTLDPSARELLSHVDRPGEWEMRSAISWEVGHYLRDIDLISDYTAHRSLTTTEQIEELAAFLRVSPESLEDLKVACHQIDSGCSFLTSTRFESAKGIQSWTNLADVVSQAGPGSFNTFGGPGLLIPKSFGPKKSEIIIADGAINTAVGLTLGWNVIGCARGEEYVAAAIRLLEDAEGEIRVLADYSPSEAEDRSGTINSDSVTPDGDKSREMHQRDDMEPDDDPSGSQARAYPSIIQTFVESLQRGVTVRVSIIDVPREFRAIRLAAYLKSQSE